jgi:antitoxin (DNA-binding transcriptional repressor) of toxin-antitoxin stability system
MNLTEKVNNQGTLTKDLQFMQKELVSISKFCNSPPKLIHRVQASGDRLILVRHGHPVAGLVPLWMLSVVEDYKKGRLVESNEALDPVTIYNL